MTLRKGFFSLTMLLVFCFASCSKSESNADAERGAAALPKVLAVNYPVARAASSLGSGLIEVLTPWEGEADPAFWEPSDKDLEVILSADLILQNGADYAKWLPMIDIPARRKIDLFAGQEQLILEVPGSVTHSHGPEGDHSHGELDFTLWLDPGRYRIQVEAVAEAVKGIVEKKHHALVDQRLASYAAEIELFDDEIDDVRLAAKGWKFAASHPVYNYLGDYIGAEMKNYHWEPQAAVPADELAELIEFAKKHPKVIMLWEGEPAADVRSALEQAGVIVMVYPTHCSEGSSRSMVGQFFDSFQELQGILTGEAAMNAVI